MITEPRNPTGKLASQICAITVDNLDLFTISTDKRLITEDIAVAIAYHRETSSSIVAGHVRELDFGPNATVWGFELKTTLVFVGGWGYPKFRKHSPLLLSTATD